MARRECRSKRLRLLALVEEALFCTDFFGQRTASDRHASQGTKSALLAWGEVFSVEEIEERVDVPIAA